VHRQLNVVLGKGDGTFEGQTYPAHNLPQAVAAADFNGDGKLDLAVANLPNFGVQDNYTLSILLNKGDGTFGSATNYLAGSGSVAVVTGDFNHDGRQDVALANRAEKTISVFLGNGNGTLACFMHEGCRGGRLGTTLRRWC
jgi:hypothetical protein